MSKDQGTMIIGGTLVCRRTPVGNHCLRTQGTHEANDEPWIEEKRKKETDIAKRYKVRLCICH